MREKYFSHNIYKAEMPTLVRNKHIFINFFLPTEKVRALSFENGHQSACSHATWYKLMKTILQRFCIIGKKY